MMAEVLEPIAAAGRGGKFRGDQHLAAQRFAQSFNARRLVDGRPDYREIEAIGSADIAVQHFPDMERKVDFSDRFTRFNSGAIDPVQGVHCLSCGLDRITASLGLW